jgi:hypothetical protein
MRNTSRPARSERVFKVNTIMAVVRRHLDHAVRENGIRRGTAGALLVAPYLILAVFFFLMSWPVTQDFTALMTFPSYPIEWATFVVFLLGGIMSLRLAMRARRSGEHRLVWIFYLLFAIGLLWTAGEVNAWGQKIFGYETPSWMDLMNEQHQMTMHNLRGWQNHNHWLRLAFALGGFMGIALNNHPRYRKIAAPAILFSWFLVIAFKCALDFWTKDFPIESSYGWLMFNWIVNRVSKIVKLMVGISAVVYLWLNRRKFEDALARKTAGEAPLASRAN